MEKLSLVVDLEASTKIRVDKYLATKNILSRSQLKERLVKIYCNNKLSKVSHKVSANDEVYIELRAQQESELVGEDLELDIIFANENLIVLNKAPGIVVHPGNGHRSATLIQGILYHFQDIKGMLAQPNIEKERPGIVHRLDKDTSGVIVVARTTRMFEFLSAQFRARTVDKSYLAIIKGIPNRLVGQIENYLGRSRRDRKLFSVVKHNGKEAITSYRILKTWESNFTLVLLKPHTGRTHQLRVHMQFLGHPILGDPLYSRAESTFRDSRLMLHARSIELSISPELDRVKTFKAPLPQDFRLQVKKLNSLFKQRIY